MVIYQNVFALFSYPPMHPSIYLLFGVVTIKGTKVVVECNEKLYYHYFEELCNQLYLMNSLFIFWNCVCLFMRFKFHEFGIISLCLKSPFTNKKHLLNHFFQHIENLDVTSITQNFTNFFQICYRF
jgi:hypothetical protein